MTHVDVDARRMNINAWAAFVAILIVIADDHRRIGMIDTF
jgi:hypothetical protein